MTFEDIHKLVVEMNISDEGSLAFKSATIILTGIANNTVSENKIKRITGYLRNEVEFIMHNLRANGIARYSGGWWVDLSDENSWMELILCSLAGSGELSRVDESFVSEEKRITWEDLYGSPYKPIKSEVLSSVIGQSYQVSHKKDKE